MTLLRTREGTYCFELGFYSLFFNSLTYFSRDEGKMQYLIFTCKWYLSYSNFSKSLIILDHDQIEKVYIESKHYTPPNEPIYISLEISSGAAS